jgi:hypothetical protein
MTGQYLNRDEAAAYLTDIGCRIKPSTLATLASRGGGPLFAYRGRNLFYELADLDAWAASRLSPKTDISKGRSRLAKGGS